MRSAARFEESPIRRRFAVIVLMAFLLLARKLLGRSEARLETGSTWAEDLATDRRFEWSLITREIGAILLIALLILARQLLS